MSDLNACNIDEIADLLDMDMTGYDYHQGSGSEEGAGEVVAATCRITLDIFKLAKTSQEKSSYRTNQSLLPTTTTLGRPIQETHALYICPARHWKEKVNLYIQCTHVFSYIGPMLSNACNEGHVRTALRNMRHRILY